MRIESSFASSFDKANTEIEYIFHQIKRKGIILDKRLYVILQFVLREIFNNAIEHGNKFDVKKNITYKLKINKVVFEVEVKDEGEGFDLKRVVEEEKNGTNDRKRSRGLLALVDMGMSIGVKDGAVKVKILISMYNNTLIGDENVMDVKLENSRLICKLGTEIIAANTRELVNKIKEKLDEDLQYDEVVLDMSATEIIDSMGVTFLIGAYKEIEQRGKNIRFHGVSVELMSLFKIMKLDEIFKLQN